MRQLGVVALVGALVGGAGCASEDACARAVPGTMCEIAGTGALAFNDDGLPAANTDFYLPSETRRGPDGLLYIMDYNNMRLRRIEANGKVTTVAGNGIHADAMAGHNALQSSLENPIDFDFLPDGRVVLISYHDPRVLMVDTDDTLQVIAGSVNTGLIGNEGDGGPATAAEFISLAGITVGPDGAIYLADDMANRVRVIRDGIVTTLAGTGVPRDTGDGGLATAATISGPTAIALDADGNVFISDTTNCSVRKVDPTGMISTVAGIDAQGFAGDGGPAAGAKLDEPQGVAVAGDGTMYIGDRLNARVRKVAPDGTISTIAGTGRSGSAGDDGPAIDAELGYIGRVQLDGDGGLLITDQSNSMVRKILPPL